MRVGVYGAGYVGVVAAAAFAAHGTHIVLTDISRQKISTIKNGVAPFFEPDLLPLLQKAVRQGNLTFGDTPEQVAALCSLHVLTVGTPALPNGNGDESQLLSAARTIGGNLTSDSIILIKSTAPIGAHRRVLAECESAVRARGLDYKIDVVVSPEFLRAGTAVMDFLRSDRVVIGGRDDTAVQAVKSLYQPFTPADRFLVTDQDSATLIKYAANAMLATRISFMNELAALAEKIDADIDDVRRGLGTDPRIGAHYLHAGAGFGGSCLPKDISALVAAAESFDISLGVVRAAAEANVAQLKRVQEKLQLHIGPVAGKVVGIWGLSFKEGTDDIRESPSSAIVASLLREGARVQVYDIRVQSNAVESIAAHASARYCDTPIEAATGADALLVMNAEQEYLSVPLSAVADAMAGRVLIDGRNCLEPASVRSAGLTYCGFGRGACN